MTLDFTQTKLNGFSLFFNSGFEPLCHVGSMWPLVKKTDFGVSSSECGRSGAAAKRSYPTSEVRGMAERSYPTFEFCQKNSLVIANTLFQQHKRGLYTWISSDGQHWNQIDYILCSQRWRSSIQLAKTRPGADCGTEHELLIAKFRLKLKKVGKTTRPFRYDLNQICNEYSGSEK